MPDTIINAVYIDWIPVRCLLHNVMIFSQKIAKFFRDKTSRILQKNL
jgi:hypothetical protein